MWYNLVVVDSTKPEYEKEVLTTSAIDALRTLKVSEDSMEEEVGDGAKEKLSERLGEALAEQVLKQEDSSEIIQGLFFGEAENKQ